MYHNFHIPNIHRWDCLSPMFLTGFFFWLYWLFFTVDSGVSVRSIHSVVSQLVGSCAGQQEAEAWGIPTASRNILSGWCSTCCLGWKIHARRHKAHSYAAECSGISTPTLSAFIKLSSFRVYLLALGTLNMLTEGRIPLVDTYIF